MSDKPALFAYASLVSTKRNIKPFSRNPKTKTRVLATKSSLLKASHTFQTKPKAAAKTKKVHKAVIAPVIAPVEILMPAPVAVVSTDVEQANKSTITLALAKINDALKAVKISARAKCDKQIQEAETKAIAARAAVYLKAKQAGKFPTTWTYPKEFLPEAER